VFVLETVQHQFITIIINSVYYQCLIFLYILEKFKPIQHAYNPEAGVLNGH